MKRILTILTLISSVLLIYSCPDNPTGMFYSLEEEIEIANGSLDDALTVRSMGKFGTGTDETYFAAAGNLYFKKTDDIESSGVVWNYAKPPGSTESENSNYITYEAILLNGKIFAVYYDTDTTEHHLYSCEASSLSADSVSLWTEVDINQLDSSAGEYVVNIEIADTTPNQTLFIYTITPNATVGGYSTSVYNVYSYTAPVLDITAAMTLTEELTEITNGGTFDVDVESDNTFWLISGIRLYTGATGSLSEISDTAVFDDTDAGTDDEKISDLLLNQGYGGLVCYNNGSTDYIYLTLKEGYILRYDGSSWTDAYNTDIYSSSADTYPDPLDLDLYDVELVTFGDEKVLLFGTNSGYYELQIESAGTMNTTAEIFSPEDSTSLFCTKTHYTSIDLSNAVITDFYYDSDYDYLFALGFNNGLWFNYESSDSSRLWAVE